MVQTLKTLGRRLKALHRDEQGADMVEYILLIAAIALPLLALVIWFRRDIGEAVKGWWQDIKGEAESDIQNP